MPRDLLLPASILAGAALIAAGLFFGLRAQQPPPPPAAISTPTPPPAPPAPPTLTPELQKTVESQAVNALATLHPALVKTCWEPFLKTAPTPAASRYVYGISFDPQGTQIGQGISELRGESRADVARCLREQPMSLRVPPPGVNVSLQVTVAFP